MSLQATDAVLVELDKDGSVKSEKHIQLELVQKGDILKVRGQSIPHNRLMHCIVKYL